MALISCKECGTEISSKAETCPKCGVKTASNSIGCGGWILIFLVGIVVYAAFSPSNSPSLTSDTPLSTSSPVAVKPTPKQPGSQWSYLKHEDPMAKGQFYQAIVQSSNTVNFEFPYAGPQRASLILRTHPRYGKDVILRIEKGQILCRSYDTCKVLVRFDEKDAVTFSGIGPADNDSTTVFIQNYNRFLSGILNSRIVRISVDVYRNGAPVFEFDISDFDQNKYLSKGK